MLNRPRAARRGTAGIFAPSSPFGADRFAVGLEALERLGYRTKLHPQHQARRGFLAGTDAERVEAFHQLLDDPEVDIVWAARGGYGAMRFLPDVDAERIRRAAKPIVGFSDVTALLAFSLRHAQLVPIHGPVITQLGDLPETDLAMLDRILAGDYAGATYQADGITIRAGIASGPVIGGNLTVIDHLLGTDYAFSWEGAILILEDVSEAPYRLDRTLTQLRLAGALGRVAGVALGDFLKCDPPRAGEPTALDVLSERLSDLGVPVQAGFPIGHGSRNQAVPLGVIATLDTGARTLTLAS